MESFGRPRCLQTKEHKTPLPLTRSARFATIRARDRRNGGRLAQPQGFEILILCSGAGGKLLAWQTAISGRQTAVIEYRRIGGSCPNIGCLPSKNEIWSTKVIHRALNAEPFGTATGTIAIDMGKVRQRKREMSEKEIATHLQNHKLTGAELIVRAGCFVAPKTIEVRLNGGGTRLITGNHGLLNVGTQAAIPNISSLEAARPPDSHGSAKSPLCAVPSDRAQAATSASSLLGSTAASAARDGYRARNAAHEARG